MAGLMMVFLLISVAFMMNLQNRVEAPMSAERELCDDLRNQLSELEDELGTHFVIGDVEGVDGRSDHGLNCLTVRFPGGEGRFESGSSELTPEFKSTLNRFFPAYLVVLQEWEQGDEGRRVKEVRIEGHTSSVWEGETVERAYFRNMGLSQDRTRSVLEYVQQEVVTSDRNRAWVRERVRAVGFSSSQLVVRGGSEDRDASRRVLFRVATNLEDVLRGVVEGDPVASGGE